MGAVFLAKHRGTGEEFAVKLMLPESAPLPSNDEIEAALAEHHALFGGEAHERSLRKQREQALAWMRRLAAECNDRRCRDPDKTA